MRDRCPSVIIPCIYPLTCQFSKFSNKWFWCIIVVLKIVLTVKELAKESSVLCRCFHEDHPFFEVFSNKWNGQFFDSEYLSKNWNWPFFDSEILKNQIDDSLKLQRTAQHCCQEHVRWICGCALPHTHTNKNKIK
jgi:hypothetical protein